MVFKDKVKYRAWQREHPNFMTPHVVKAERKGNYIIEVSEGEDFEHKGFYGVSLIEEKEDGTFKVDQSGKNKP